jgi:Uma2 family endonuclease
MAIPSIPRSLVFRDIDKPYVESICGRLVPKVSPRRTHALLQARLARRLEDWAGDRGEVGTEWRFYLLREHDLPSSLVPDVAYVSFERLPRDLPSDARERPRIAPDIATEIVSPTDSKRTLEEKIDLYLRHGSRVVIVVDPRPRTVALHTRDGNSIHPARGAIAVPPYDDLVLDLGALFAGV